MITLHGSPRTRTNRVYWLLRELGLPFEIVQGAKLLAQDFPSPMRKQPVLVDSDGTVMYESLAINLYLARKYGSRSDSALELCPRTSAEDAATLQFTMWAMTELDPRLFELNFHSPLVEAAGHPLADDGRYLAYFGRPRSAARAQRLCKELDYPLRVLERELAGAGPFLLPGRGFTVVDLNVSIVLSWTGLAPHDLLADLPSTRAWLRRCLKRPHSPTSSPHPATGSFEHDERGFQERYGSLGSIDAAPAAKL